LEPYDSQPVTGAPQASRVGHYQILDKLGAGGMGEVYRARDETLGRDVALKFLHSGQSSDESARKRLLREARTASSLNHPNICTIYEVGETNGSTYIAMEYLQGRTLSSIAQGGQLTAEDAYRYALQIADALAYAHAHGIVHRDLKSANILVTREGYVKVLDFGLAKKSADSPAEETLSASLTTDGSMVGTIQYMAPETLRGVEADARVDVWAMGVILYEMSTGKLPFAGGTRFEVTSAILRDCPKPLPLTCPSSFQALIAQCLAKDPQQRYQTAAEVKAALAMMDTKERNRLAPRPRQLMWKLALVPVLAAGLALCAFVWIRRAREAADTSNPRRIQSLAVLPLANLSGDTQQEYLVDGMTEILITDLAKMGSQNRVIARNSVMQFKNSDKSLRDIAHLLNVDAIVTGSVTTAGTRLRVTAQLIDPSTSNTLWAQEYDRELTDVISLQGEIALALAREINIELTPQEKAVLKHAPLGNPAAHESYLKGRYYWNKRDTESVKTGLKYFRQAIDQDPTYAPAYAGIADSYVILADLEAGPSADLLAKAKEAASKALQLDPNLAEAHASLGSVYSFNISSARESEHEFEIALRLNPNYATALHWYALELVIEGRLDEALAKAQRARELDPLSLIINSYVGQVLYLKREYKRSIAQLRSTVEMDSNFYVAHDFLARSLLQAGDLQNGALEAGKAVELSKEVPDTLAILAYAEALAGKKADAVNLLNRVQSSHGFLPPEAAFTYARLGERDLAFRVLEDAWKRGRLWSISLTTEPALDPLRADRRLTDLIHSALP
jgi:serine/threonine protein kinase/tetratricopeptide (TPR) repeat protein